MSSAEEFEQLERALGEQAAELRAAVDYYTQSGELICAAEACTGLGEVLEQLGNHDGTESAYREAVVLARQVDAEMPELMLSTFTSLIDFLAPSQESITLAHELATNMIDRDEMYDPIDAAEAAYQWAIAELKFAAVAPHRVDHAIDGIVRPAIEMQDDVCFHERSQDLQRRVAELLRSAGRHPEADQWQTEADEFERWELFGDQTIPGHVHSWDIRD